MEDKVLKFPTETIELPSKGLQIYPQDNPLSSGVVEMKYMSAKEEDILTNQSYIANQTVLDKLLQSLIVSDINYKDLITGDKDALFIAARILGYGKDLTFTHKNESVTVDLSTLENKQIDESLFKTGGNEFSFTLPSTKNVITFKLLTHADESDIDKEVKGLKKLNKDSSPDLSTRMKYMILSVNGDTTKKSIREFVDSPLFLASDARAFRKYIKEMQPGINLNTTVKMGNGEMEDVTVPIDITFFWPDINL